MFTCFFAPLVKSEILEPTFGVDPKSKDVPDTVPLGPAGYVDDAVQPPIAPARDIVGIMRQCAIIYHEVFSRFGPVVNCLKGKAEALCRFAGTGATSARRELFTKSGGQIEFVSRDKTHRLLATSAFKHVGSNMLEL